MASSFLLQPTTGVFFVRGVYLRTQKLLTPPSTPPYNQFRVLPPIAGWTGGRTGGRERGHTSYSSTRRTSNVYTAPRPDQPAPTTGCIDAVRYHDKLFTVSLGHCLSSPALAVSINIIIGSDYVWLTAKRMH